MIKKKRPNLRLATPSGTKSIERTYMRLVLKYQKRYRQLVQEELARVWPMLKSETQRDYPSMRLDTNMDETLNNALKRVLDRLNHEFPPSVLRSWASVVASRVDRTTDNHIENTLEQVSEETGADVHLDAEGIFGKFIEKIGKTLLGRNILFPKTKIARELNPFYENVINAQVGLIQSIATEQVPKLRTILNKALIDNKPNREISADLRKQFNISKARARLIARDQVTKLNGAVNRNKQKALGVTRYVWRAVGDERTRSKHRDLNGKTFKWNDPPIINTQGDRGHPGEDYQCRCYAEAILDDIL